MKHKSDANTQKLRGWIDSRPAANRKQLDAFLSQAGHSDYSVTHVLHGNRFARLRRDMVKEFTLK